MTTPYLQNQPLAPGTPLLVRFSTRALKVLGDPGSTYVSRQATNLPTGAALTVVEDGGADYLRARVGKAVYQVHRSDLMPKPDDQQVAHTAVRAQVAENDLATAKALIDLWHRQVLDLTAEVKALTAENDALRLRLTTARVKLEAVTKALGQA